MFNQNCLRQEHNGGIFGGINKKQIHKVNLNQQPMRCM